MASPAYVWILDQQGHEIKGDCDVQGREGSIEAFSFSYGVSLPVDRFTGSTTGTRQHETATLIKAFCPVSPILFDAAAHGKTLKQVIIRWYQLDEHGREQAYFSHQLDQVKVVSFRQQLRHTKDERNNFFVHEDEIAFRFAKISLKHHDGNIEASDTWKERS